MANNEPTYEEAYQNVRYVESEGESRTEIAQQDARRRPGGDEGGEATCEEAYKNVRGVESGVKEGVVEPTKGVRHAKTGEGVPDEAYSTMRIAYGGDKEGEVTSFGNGRKKMWRKMSLVLFLAIISVVVLGLIVGAFIMIGHLQSKLENDISRIIREIEILEGKVKESFAANLQNLIPLNKSIEGQSQVMQKELDFVERNLSKSIMVSANQLRNETTNANVKQDEVMNVTRTILEKLILVTADWFKASDNLIYKRFTDAVDYATARTRCQEIGGMLLTKGVRDETVFRELVQANVLNSARTWIGYNDLENEGNWTWMDGGVTNPSVVIWMPGEPNSAYVETSDCGHIVRLNGTKALINDYECHKSDQYVCEV